MLATELRRAALLGTIGGVIGAIGGIAGTSLAGLRTAPLLVAAALPVGVVVGAGSALLPALRVARLPLAQVLGGGELSLLPAPKRRGHGNASDLGRLALAELTRLRARALLDVAAGTVATASLLVLVGVSRGFGGTLQVTVLGQAILLSTGPLQVGITSVALVLAAALFAELLWQAVADRRREIGVLRAVGWAKRHVATLMVSQGVALGVACAALGSAVGGLVVAALLGLDAARLVILDGAPIALAAGMILGGLAAGLPAYRAATIHPATRLRME